MIVMSFRILILFYFLGGCKSYVEITSLGKGQNSNFFQTNLVINNNQALSTNELTELNLNSSHFEISDDRDSPIEYTFKVISNPNFGYITKNNIRLQVNDTFTQADLESNLIKFEHPEFLDSEQFELSKNFKLSLIAEGFESSTHYDLDININPYCDDKAAAVTYNQFGSGTKTDPYIICTAAQFNDIGANSIGWDKHYVLKADIDLGIYTGIAYNIIGDSTTPFSGSFDGLNYTISNFTYDDLVQDNVGIFGVIRGPYQSIKNFNIISANIRGADQVGIFAGFVKYADLSNINVSGSVQGSNEVGGIIGYLESSSGAYFSSTVNITSNDETGGIAGYSGRNHIQNIYWKGIINTTGENSGGLFGGFYVGILKNCFAQGSVTGTDIGMGGLVGRLWSAAEIHNCFVDVDVVGNASADSVGLVVGQDNGATFNIYYDLNSSCSNSGTGNCNAFYLSNPIDTSVQTDFFHNSTNEPLASWSFTDGWQEVSADFPSFNFVKPDPGWGDCNDHLTDTPFAGGTGTFANPFLICTADQFNQIGTNSEYYSKSFKIMQDIDLGTLGTSYNIIGDGSNPFTGKISGVGAEIQNLNINLPSNDQVGLIGAMETGFLAGIQMVNPNITGRDNVGAIIGQVINNNPVAMILSSTDGNISGEDEVGGLIGHAYRTAIESSYNSATVTGVSAVGGLLGGNTSNVLIENSFNRGDISGNNLVGGIFGSRSGSTLVNSSFSYGPVSGVTTEIGQLQGYQFAANLNGAYYSSTAICTNCDEFYGTGIDTSISPNYFFQSSNAPLNNWDWNSIWLENGTDFPTHNF